MEDSEKGEWFRGRALLLSKQNGIGFAQLEGLVGGADSLQPLDVD